MRYAIVNSNDVVVSRSSPNQALDGRLPVPKILGPAVFLNHRYIMSRHVPARRRHIVKIASHQNSISCTCLARCVAAPSRNATSVPVET